MCIPNFVSEIQMQSNLNQVVISQAKEDTDLWGREGDMNLLLRAMAQGVCPSFWTSNILLVPK